MTKDLTDISFTQTNWMTFTIGLTFISSKTDFYTRENRFYRQTSNIRRASVDNEFVDNSDVIGASPVGAAPTTSSSPT